MGNTLSMSHPPFLVSAPLLHHSDKKFGLTTREVGVLVSLRRSDSYAERAKGAEVAERALLITNSPFGPLTPLQALL